MGSKQIGERKESAGTFLDIDLDNLDKEWQRQPKLVHKWHSRLAEAKLDLNEKKARLDLITAELSLAIQNDPGHYGLESATIPSIKACVETQPQYLKAIRRHNKAKYAVDVLQATVTALDHKKKALESEVDLFLSDYFATPRNRKSKDGETGKRLARRVLKDEE